MGNGIRPSDVFYLFIFMCSTIGTSFFLYFSSWTSKLPCSVDFKLSYLYSTRHIMIDDVGPLESALGTLVLCNSEA